MRNHYIKLFVIALLVGYCVWAVYPPDKNIKKGLDLQGGMHIVLQVEQAPGEGLEQGEKINRIFRILQTEPLKL